MERYNVHDEYMTPSEAGNVVLHADAQRALDAERRERRAVEQIAGQALGYPWFKDDQKNFPGATEADGVCIGEHVAGTIVQELASKLATLQAQADHTRIERNRLWGELADLQAQLADRDAMILQMGEQAAVLAKENMAVKAQLRQVEGERDHAKKMEAVQKEVADNQTWHVQKLEGWRDTVTLALQRPGGARFEDVPGHIKALVKEHDTLRQLVEALPVAGLPVEHARSDDFVVLQANGEWMVHTYNYWAKFATEDEARAYIALLEYRASLPAQPAQGGA